MIKRHSSDAKLQKILNIFFLIKSQVALPEELFKIPVNEMLESR